MEIITSMSESINKSYWKLRELEMCAVFVIACRALPKIMPCRGQRQLHEHAGCRIPGDGLRQDSHIGASCKGVSGDASSPEDHYAGEHAAHSHQSTAHASRPDKTPSQFLHLRDIKRYCHWLLVSGMFANERLNPSGLTQLRSA